MGLNSSLLMPQEAKSPKRTRSHSGRKISNSAMDRDAQQRAILRKRQADRIEAMGHREGRALLDIEEHVGSCMKWPARFTEMMLSTHLLFPERWQARMLASNCSRCS